MDSNQLSPTTDRELLAYLVARVTVLESTLESILFFLPTTLVNLKSDLEVPASVKLALSKSQYDDMIDQRGAYASSFLGHVRTQFPDIARIVEEHIRMPHDKANPDRKD